MRLKALQGGAALMALLAVLTLGGSAYLVSRMGKAASGVEAANRTYNARVLQQAKMALLGWIAANAADTSENYPGRLPCPEPGGHVGVTAYEGISAPYVASGEATCSNIGRLPWRTLGLSKLVDASGEPLWYAVSVGSSGWALQTSATTLLINSNKSAGVSVNGLANAAVAVIIAPGPAINVNPNANQIAAGCAARLQSRATTPPNYLDYLECHDFAGNNVRTSVVDNAPNAFNDVPANGSPNTVSNDQAVVITLAEVLAVLEPVIAKRIDSQIAPVLRSVASSWGAYPFATPFADPGTSDYKGGVNTYQGLLPFTYSQSAACGADPRCTTNGTTGWTVNSGVPTIARSAGSGSFSSSCTLNASLRARCSGSFDNNNGGVNTVVRMTVNVSNVARALRDLDTSKILVEYRPGGFGVPYVALPCPGGSAVPFWACSLSTAYKSNGNADIYIDLTLPDSGTAAWNYRITVTNSPAKDNSLLDSANGTTGWFVRNEWYRLLYYAVAQGNSPAGMPAPACATGVNCLTVTNFSPSNNKRALFVLAGASLSGSARPNAALADYLEFGNASGGTTFEQQSITRLPPIVNADTGAADAYFISPSVPLAGAPTYFLAANTNTGASTLNAGGVGAKPILNSDGTGLAAGQIRANGVVRVTYDGASYTLLKQPFNDRVVVVETN